MRVLAVTPLYPPHSRVGAWLATHLFLRHLVTRGHEVTAFPFMMREKDYELDGVKVVTGRRGRSYARELAAASDVLVHHAGDDGLAAEVAEPAKRVTMVHGVGYKTVNGPSLAVFNSDSLRDASGYAGESIVCHPPTFPEDHAVSSTGSCITIVNCSQDKGIKTAWRVAEQMHDSVFLGVTGGYGHQVTARAANFATIPTQEDMRTVWAKTRVLLMPSKFETWGMAGVEAMASGIPVIAHPTPGLQESLSDAGIFIDRENTDGWVNELHRLEDLEEYAAASERALKRSAELDPLESLDRFADAIEALA